MQKLNKAELKQITIPGVKITKPENDYKLHAELRQLEQEEILVLDAYKGANAQPDYRIFIGKEDYITLNLIERRKTGKYEWKANLTMPLLNFNSYYLGGDEDKEWNSKKDEMLAKQFFQTNASAINNLRSHEEKINQMRLEERDKKILNKVDDAMNKVGELPEDFENWVREEAFYHHRYLFYQYNRKPQTEGFCTFCGENVTVISPRHNESGECPHCKSKVILKAAGKTKSISEWSNAAIIQTYEKGFVVREFTIHLKAEKDKKAEVFYGEVKRCIYPQANEFGKVVYIYGRWKQRKNRWLPPGEYINNTRLHLYHKNLKEVLRDTLYCYCGIEQLAAVHGISFGVHGFLSQYPANKYYEYFIKSGLSHIVADLSLITYYSNFTKGINRNGKKIAQVLGIEAYDIPILVQTNAGLTGLHYIKACRKKKVKLVPEQIAFVERYFANKEKDFLKLLDYTTPHKAIRFLIGERGAIARRYSLWIDYIDICKKLRYDMTNTFLLFPKHLKQAHDLAVEEYNKKLDEKKKKEENKKHRKIRQMYQTLNDKYYMESNDLFIRAPKDAAEIITEGHALHHCVAGYTGRVAAGDTIILFLRKKKEPNKPYFTVEVKGNKVTQYHGKYNDARTLIPEKVHDFIKKFKAEKLKQKKEVVRVQVAG